MIDKIRSVLFRRRTAYQQVFRGPLGGEVLADLAKFCRADKSTFDADPRIHAMLEGRREVWLRLQHHLQLSPDDLWRLYTGSPKE